MLLNASLFEFQPENKTYCEEISLLGRKCESLSLILRPSAIFTMRDCPRPGMHRSFQFAGVDRSGGDIAGWRFEEMAGPNHSGLKVLIIND